ncbi:MAG: NHL repeat-containing protein [Spirochaetaceae bacterium]|jgi:DNA-binding beta-propeller fold protein YncE|nr:NHL repeat-containing protein [Spirochaetaceae bacterium]
MKRLYRPSFFFVLIAILLPHAGVLAQDDSAVIFSSDIDALHAAESFRIGVEAYNRNSFNEAIFAFEQALSWRVGERLIVDWLNKERILNWLGRAYYRSGMENIALRQWQSAAAIYGPSSPDTVLINSWIERVGSRRSFFPYANDSTRYVEIGRFPGSVDDVVSFSQPSSVLPENDGSLWVAAYGSNEIVRLDVNGIVRSRERGPLVGFDRPFALARGLDDRIYISEFRGGRVSILSPDGKWLAHIGSKGINSGQLSGPASLTIDDEGYLYVVEFGNRRVSKFDPDGAFINMFGVKSAEFTGFLAPAGIAARGGIVYVADSIAKCIYTFDSDGLYLGVLRSGELEYPENLRFLSDGSLLVVDTKRLLIINPDTGVTRVLYAVGSSRIRFIDGSVDANGALVAADFNSDEVTVLAPVDDVASGFFVSIDRVISEDFPELTVELRVEDNRRNPIVGLAEGNFFISEMGAPVQNQTFIAAGNAATSADITILLERSTWTANMRDTFAAALRDINTAMEGTGNVVSIISAGEQPVRERFSGNNLAAAAQPAAAAAAYTPRWRFDLGLRLAATDLLSMSPKRAIIFISSGRGLGELTFEQYSLNELAAYMANNGIVFHTILAGENPAPVSGEIRYLCNETGGSIIRLYQPEGIAPLIKKLVSEPSGCYILRYTSALSTNFGRAFLPVEAEVYLLERSGRDAVGYFPPLE